MKITVTGGAGFIGSHVVDLLFERGHNVRVIDNLSTGNIDNLRHILGGITFAQQDASTPAGAARACSGADAIIHLAAIPSVARSMTEPGGLRKDNLLSTLRLLRAAEDFGVRRFVYASTCAVYAEKDGAFIETDPVAPLSPYAKAKFAGEQAVREFGERSSRWDSVSLRLFNVVGARQRASGGYAAVIPAFVDTLLAGEIATMYGDGNQTRDFVSVRDVAKALIVSAERTKPFGGSVINVASGHSKSINYVSGDVSMLVDGCLKDSNYVYADARPGEMYHVMADVNKAVEELGIDFDESLTEMIRDYVEWKKGEKK